MAVQHVIDSHVHLWPGSMSNEHGHAWMTPGMPLAKQHLLGDYCTASEQDERSPPPTYNVQGVVYVETDVRYDSPSSELATWTKGPLDEIRFLRSVVEGSYGDRDSRMLLGIVLWAPMDQPPAILEQWLALAEQTAGPETWSRVKGFRYLLQAIHDAKAFEMLVFSSDFLANLQLLGKRGFSFDVGVDQRSGGIWQLEAMSKAMALAHENIAEHERAVFVLNHLCKPDFDLESQYWPAWRRAVQDMSRHSKTYMKLSGAFSELPEGLDSTSDVAKHIRPWVEHILECFGCDRVMFGSDWPVCNARGPGQGDSWVAWKEVVRQLLADDKLGLSAQSRGEIFEVTAKKAYRLQ